MKEYKYESMILQAYTPEDLPNLVKMYESWKTLHALSQEYGRAVLVPDVLSGGLLGLVYGLPRVAKGARHQAFHVDNQEGYLVKTSGTSYDLMPYNYDQNRTKTLFIDFYGQDGELKGDFWVYEIPADLLDEAAQFVEERNSRSGRGGGDRKPRISIKRDVIRRKGMEGEHFNLYSLDKHLEEVAQES